MQAFDGVRVLDLTHVLAGPYATYQLALLGADVIKIEGPGHFDMNREIGAVASFSDVMMGSHFQSQAGNKRAITLDLKTDEGREIFLALAKTADVIVENMRTGTMDKLGVGYDAVRAIKPDIIFCSLTGFGQTGPKATHAAFDNTIQAYSGMMLQTGTSESGAMLIGPPVLDYGSGIYAAFAIAQALFRRERTGQGQRLDVAMLDAALALMTSAVLNANTTGLAPGRSQYGRVPFAAYGGYETADGELLMIGACTPAQHVKLWRALGRDDLADAMDGLRTTDMMKRTDIDEPVLVEILKTKTAEEWEEILIEAGLPVARVRSINEALASDQVASRGIVGSFPSDYSKHGELKPAVAPFLCDVDGPTVSGTPAELGRDTDEVLAELGYDGGAVAGLRERGVV